METVGGVGNTKPLGGMSVHDGLTSSLYSLCLPSNKMSLLVVVFRFALRVTETKAV